MCDECTRIESDMLNEHRKDFIGLMEEKRSDINAIVRFGLGRELVTGWMEQNLKVDNNRAQDLLDVFLSHEDVLSWMEY